MSALPSVLATLLALLLTLPGAALATSAKTTTQTVDELLKLIDGSAKESRLDSLDKLRKAGFTYEKHLVVPPELSLTCKSEDEKNIIAGMRSVDWDYAVFYGQPVPRGEACILPYTGNKASVTSPPLKDQEWQQVEADPGSREARQILLERSMDFQRQMLEQARQEPEALQALGARLYGATLESLYIMSILVLAAEESDSLDYLKQLHAGTFARQNKIYAALLRNRHLGAQEHNKERAAIIGQVQKLLEKKQRRARLKGVAPALEIVQAERDRYLSPCREK